jgi:hypothetical protein
MIMVNQPPLEYHEKAVSAFNEILAKCEALSLHAYRAL